MSLILITTSQYNNLKKKTQAILILNQANMVQNYIASKPIPLHHHDSPCIQFHIIHDSQLQVLQRSIAFLKLTIHQAITLN